MHGRLSSRLIEGERRDRRTFGSVRTFFGLLGTAFSVLAVWFTSTFDVGRPHLSFYVLVAAGPFLLLLGLLLRRGGEGRRGGV